MEVLNFDDETKSAGYADALHICCWERQGQYSKK